MAAWACFVRQAGGYRLLQHCGRPFGARLSRPAQRKERREQASSYTRCTWLTLVDERGEKIVDADTGRSEILMFTFLLVAYRHGTAYKRNDYEFAHTDPNENCEIIAFACRPFFPGVDMNYNHFHRCAAAKNHLDIPLDCFRTDGYPNMAAWEIWFADQTDELEDLKLTLYGDGQTSFGLYDGEPSDQEASEEQIGRAHV